MGRGLGTEVEAAPVTRSGRVRPSRTRILSEHRPDIAACLVEDKSGFSADEIGLMATEKAVFRCRKCGDERTTSVETAVRAKDGTLCGKCSPRKKRQKQQQLSAFPELAAELVSGPNGEGADELTAGSKKMCDWKCRRCGNDIKANVESRVRHFKKGRQTCGRCSAIANGSLAKLHPAIAAELVRDKDGGPDPAFLAAKSQKSCKWRCSSCQLEWTATVAARTSGSQCPACQTNTWTAERMRKELSGHINALTREGRMSREERIALMEDVGVMGSADEARVLARDFIEGDISRRELAAWAQGSRSVKVMRSLDGYDRAEFRDGKEYIPREVRRACYERDNHACRACGSKSDPLAIDHVVPEAWGGRATLENTQTLCRSCNSIKGNRPVTLNTLRARALAEGRPVEVFPSLLEEWNQVQAFRSYGVEPDSILSRDELKEMFPDAEGIDKSKKGPFSGAEQLEEQLRTKKGRREFVSQLKKEAPEGDRYFQQTIDYIASDNPHHWPLFASRMLFFNRKPKERKPLTADEQRLMADWDGEKWVEPHII